MKDIAYRFVAIMLLVIPGVIATYGFLEMKDAVFDYVAAHGSGVADVRFPWWRMIFGFILFGCGVGFIGGWIFFRDRKRNYVAPRFKSRNRKKKP